MTIAALLGTVLLLYNIGYGVPCSPRKGYEVIMLLDVMKL